MWDRKKALHEEKPAIAVIRHVGTDLLQMNRLMIVGRQVAVIRKRHVCTHTSSKALKLEIPVKPSAGIFFAEQDQ